MCGRGFYLLPVFSSFSRFHFGGAGNENCVLASNKSLVLIRTACFLNADDSLKEEDRS